MIYTKLKNKVHFKLSSMLNFVIAEKYQYNLSKLCMNTEDFTIYSPYF